MTGTRMLWMLAVLGFSRGLVEAASYQRYPSIASGPRQEHSVVALNQSVYVIGGVEYDFNSTIQTINRVEVLDTDDNLWTTSAPLPVPVNHANAAAVDEILYVLGALSSGPVWSAIGNSFSYSPYNDSWTTISAMPNGTWRGSSAVGVYDSKIYIAGGMTYLQPYPGGTQDAVSTVTSYDTSSDTWDTSLPPLPSPRQHVGGAVVNNTFYVLGGRADGIGEVQNTVFALDLTNVTAGWRTLSPMPTARGGVACAALDADSSNAKIYCLGGENPSLPPYGVYNNNEVYDVTTDSWQELAPMAVPRHGAGAVGLNGRVYYPGGGTRYGGAAPVGVVDAYVP